MNGSVFSIAVFVVVTICRYNRRAFVRMSKRRDVKQHQRASVGRPTRGRPPIHQEAWSKVSVVLFDRQIVHLDRIVTDIRGRSGKVVNRAEIIRALIDGLIDSGMDVTASGSEADLRAKVARRLGTPFR